MRQTMSLFAAVAAVSLVPMSAQGQNYVWTGAAGTSEWTTAGNWNLDGSPAAAAPPINDANAVRHVQINSGTVNVTGTRDIARNTQGNTQTVTGGTLNISASHRYGILGASSASGTGYLSGTGAIISGGLFQLGVQDGTVGEFFISDSGALTASHMALGSGGSTSVGTLHQDGGTVTLNGPSGSFIGHQGQGTYNLISGTLIREMPSGAEGHVSIGIGTGAVGHLNQTGGAVELRNGAGLSVGPAGQGTYSISNGSIEGAFLNIGAGTSGVVNVGTNAEMDFTGDLNLFANGSINFEFGASNVSTMNFGGLGLISADGVINVDGSAYTGGEGVFTLINAASFDETPIINLVGFTYPASSNWDLENGTFTVSVVVPEPASLALLGLGGLLLGRRSRR